MQCHTPSLLSSSCSLFFLSPLLLAHRLLVPLPAQTGGWSPWMRCWRRLSGLGPGCAELLCSPPQSPPSLQRERQFHLVDTGVNMFLRKRKKQHIWLFSWQKVVGMLCSSIWRLAASNTPVCVSVGACVHACVCVLLNYICFC